MSGASHSAAGRVHAVSSSGCATTGPSGRSWRAAAPTMPEARVSVPVATWVIVTASAPDAGANLPEGRPRKSTAAPVSPR